MMLLAVAAKVTPPPGTTPAFGSGPWLILMLCVVAVIAIFVAVLAAGIWSRRKHSGSTGSRRAPR